MNLKAMVSNFLLLLVSVLVALIVGELIIRGLYKDQITLFPRYHTDANYGDYKIRKIMPNMRYKHRSVDGVFHFETNNKGFRNYDDVEYPKTDNTLRVFCVGDSHTQGQEVNQEETFSYICQKQLANFGGTPEVLNAGVSGFSTAESLILVENELVKYDPDVVVLGFFENDFIDNIRCGIFELQDTNLVVKKKEHLPGVKIQNKIYRYKIIHFLGENSYLYAYTFNAVWAFYKKRLEKDKRDAMPTEYAVRVEKVDEYQQKLALRLLERMFEFCQQNDILLVIVDIPGYEGNSSIPQEIVNDFRNNSDTLFHSADLMKAHNEISETHVAHGNRHIGPEMHCAIGNELAKYLNSVAENNNTRVYLD